MTGSRVAVPDGASTALRAGLYGRASSDPKKRGRSIKDQFAVAEIECLDRSWQIIDRYEDRDRSASRRARKTRENWERLVADVEHGKIDVIVYAERSRASRDMEVSMKLRSLCERTGVLLCYDGRVYNMRTPADRKEFTRDAVASEEEAETIIMRAERTARLNGKRGAPHGRIPFGYMRRYDPGDGHLIGQFPHPEHAAVVLEAFRMVDRHDSLTSVQDYLRQYVPDIHSFGVRHILKNRVYIGERGHKGEYVKAMWDGIVPKDLFDRVQVIVKDPARRTQRDTRAKYLLSCIGMCYKCLELYARFPTLVHMRPERRGALDRIRCRVGHVAIPLPVIDAFVEENLLAWLRSPALRAVFARSSEDDGERDRLGLLIDALRGQLAEARELAGTVDAMGTPGLSVHSLAGIERSLLPQITAAEEQLQRLTIVGDPDLDRLMAAAPEDIEALWEGFTMLQRRHVVRRCVNVTLNRARAQGVRELEPGRITLVFVGEPGFVPAALRHPAQRPRQG